MILSSLARLFPPPQYLAPISAGVDLSDRSLKFVQLSRHGQHEWQLERYGQKSIPLDVMQSGQIKNKAALIENLKVAKAEWKLDQIVASLPEESAYIVAMKLPPGSEGNEREAIELQLEEHVPLTASDAVFDFEPVLDTPHLVTVSAFPRKLVEDYEEVFAAAGLTPLALEIEAQAIARAVVPRDSHETVLLIDFGKTRTSFFVVDRGTVVFSSTTRQLGGDLITRAIEKDLGVDTAEAQRLQAEHGLRRGTKVSLDAALAPALSVLRDETFKLESYCKEHINEHTCNDGRFDRLLLCGGEASLPGLVEYLHSQINSPVELANVWVNAFDPSAHTPALPFRDSLRYATAVGLALRH